MSAVSEPKAGGGLFNPDELPETARKGRAGEIYLEAVAVACGYETATWRTDYDCVDVEVKSLAGRATQLAFQVKCTSQPIFAKAAFSFSVTRRTYDRLRRETTVPRLLLVVVAPEDFQHWCRLSERRMSLRRCGYWISLKGLPDVPNKTAITLQIPRVNLLTPAALQALMQNGAPPPDLAVVEELES